VVAVALPTLAALTLIIPFVELCRPGQPAPYDYFPFLALAIVALAGAIGVIVVRRRPSTGAGEGSALSGS